MKSEENVKALISRRDALDKSMPKFCQIEAEVKGMKADVAAANLRVGISAENLSTADLNRLVEVYLEAW